MTSWADSYPGADIVMLGINRFDSLRDRAIATGEIDYYEINNATSLSMEEYLLSGPYNYSNETQASAKNTIGILGFYKKDCFSGSAILFATYPWLNNFDNSISYQEGIVAGCASLYDKTWFRDRMKTLWFVAYTSRTYCGDSWNNRTSSIAMWF